MTVDPEIPVPPVLYGGIERMVDMLVRGLDERGHDVTLFAHPQSQTPASIVPYHGSSSLSRKDTLRNLWTVASTVARGQYDIVHSFGRLAYVLPWLPTGLPKIMSYQRGPSPRSVRWGIALSRNTLHFCGCSEHIMRNWIDRPNVHVIHNAAPRATYRFEPVVPADAPLVFLGRVEYIKGAHVAIEVACRSGRRLILAGNTSPGEEHQHYFATQIAPFVDGDRVQYVGPVDDVQKNELLGQAAALLMPIQWEEPFGIVMAEALACGTPVIGLRRGAVPEVVRDGLTGFVCDTAEEMATAVAHTPQLDRAACRADMERRFSDDAMVSAYELLYFEIIQARKRGYVWS